MSIFSKDPKNDCHFCTVTCHTEKRPFFVSLQFLFMYCVVQKNWVSFVVEPNQNKNATKWHFPVSAETASISPRHFKFRYQNISDLFLLF